MHGQNVSKAVAMLRAMASGDPDLATRDVSPDGYLEHDAAVGDGLAGLREHVSRQPAGGGGRPEVVRAVEEGPFVMLHGRGRTHDGAIFFDVFRFEDERIAEHWTFSAPAAGPNQSGHTQTDGPTEPKPGEDAEKNKAVVKDYYRTVHIGGDHDAIDRHVAGDVQIRHEPGVRDGVAAFKADLARLTQSRTIDEIVLVFGQGDFVFLAARGTHEGRPCVYIDLYRVEGGKLVEHWGFPQEPPEERRNHNGML